MNTTITTDKLGNQINIGTPIGYTDADGNRQTARIFYISRNGQNVTCENKAGDHITIPAAEVHVANMDKRGFSFDIGHTVTYLQDGVYRFARVLRMTKGGTSVLMRDVRTGRFVGRHYTEVTWQHS